MTRPSTRVRLSFLLMRAGGTGGIPRTVVNLANHLVDHFDVRLISVNRVRNRTTFEVDERVKVRYLIDSRPGRRARLEARVARGTAPTTDPGPDTEPEATPSEVFPADPVVTAEREHAVIESVSALRPGIVVPTRPSLMLLAGRYAPPGVTVVGQEHLTFSVRTKDDEHRALMREVVSRLDAFVTLTQGDADDYRAMLPDVDTLITPIPNALSWPLGEPAPLAEKVIVAAGRLDPQKAFGRLLNAFAPVAAARPDWRLDIYGFGDQQDALQHRIDTLGIGERARLCGYTRDLPQVLSRASVFAMSSIYEGFPMVLLEAMTAGLPMIAYDCPRGPAELIRDGVNGVLVPDGDGAAYTAGLLRMVDDADLRRSMGLAAWQDAHAYQMPAIVDRWVDLFRRVHH